MSAGNAGAAGVEDVDLGYLMAPLSRERLELVIAKIIYNHPEELEKLVLESRKAANITSIESEVKLVFENPSTSGAASIPQIEHHVSTARNYVLAKDSKNATAIMSVVTRPFVESLRDAKVVAESGTEERALLDEFIVELETVWEKAINIAGQETKVEDLTELFKELSSYRIALTPLLGPIFSDPLRALKKRIRRATGTGRASSSGASKGPPAKKQKS